MDKNRILTYVKENYEYYKASKGVHGHIKNSLSPEEVKNIYCDDYDFGISIGNVTYNNVYGLTIYRDENRSHIRHSYTADESPIDFTKELNLEDFEVEDFSFDTIVDGIITFNRLTGENLPLVQSD